MKTKTQKLRYSKYITLCVIALFVIGITSIEAQTVKPVKPVKPVVPVQPVNSIHKVEHHSGNNEEVEGELKSIHAKKNIDFRPMVRLDIYDTETQILPARNNSVEVMVKYIAEAKDEETLTKLHNAIEKNLIQVIGEDIDISLKFYKNYSSFVNMPLKSRITIELKDNSKIVLSKFKITELKVYLPADLDMKLKAKYCKVNLDFSINGKLALNTYDAEFKGKSISKEFRVEDKYSKIEIASAGKTRLNLYESRFYSKKLGVVKIESKYSHANLGEIGNLQMSGYEDNVKIASTPNAEITGKYCNVEIESNEFLKAYFYEGSLKSNTSKKVDLKGKYLEAEFTKLKYLKMVDGYEMEIEIAEIDSLISRNGKYNEFELQKLNSILDIAGYEEEVKIEKVADNFSKIVVSGKYVDVNATISKDVSYKLYGTVRYPDFNIDKSDYKVANHDMESSNLTFEYYKGSEKTQKEIKIEGYEMDLNIY